MANPSKYLDVHMDKDGLNFTCGTCHKTTGHEVPGSRYTPTATDEEQAHMRGKVDNSNPATCQACHGNKPRTEKMAQAERAHRQDRLPDLPHSRVCPRSGHQDDLGLVHRRQDARTASHSQLKDSAGKMPMTARRATSPGRPT